MPEKYGEILGQQLGNQAAGTGLGEVMSMLFQGWKNKNQLRQNQALMDQQIAGQKEMGFFNIERQMDLWNRTNAGAQMEHYKKAGLNPALMYEGGGPGGSTAANTGGVATATAGHIGQGHTGMGILMPAQVELMRAQARNLDADTAKKSGVDTQVGYGTLEKLKAETSNVKVQTAIAKIQKDIAEISQEDVTDALSLTAQKLQQEVHQLVNQTDISDATKTTIVKTVLQEYLNKVLEGQMMKSGISVNSAQIQKLTSDVLQGWKGLSLEERKVKVQEMLGGEQKDQDQIIQLIDTVFDSIINGVILRRFLGGGTPKPVQGFRR